MRAERNFTYKLNLKLRLAWMLLVTTIGIILGVIATIRGEILGGLIFSIVWAVLFISVTTISVLGSSGIRVTEHSINSVIFGRIWKSILWADVRVVRVLSIPDPQSGKMMNNYYVERTSSEGFSFKKLANISFRGDIKDFDDLREIMNCEIKQRRIKVIAPGDQGGGAMEI